MINLRGAVKWFLGVVVAAIVLHYLEPYFNAITLVILLGLVFPLMMVSVDAVLFFEQRGHIKSLKNTYVVPWQRYFTTKILLAIRETQNLNYDVARQHLQDVVKFLEETFKTRYLREMLKEPYPRSPSRTQSFAILGHLLLRKTRLVDLSPKINALKTLAQIVGPGKEKEACQHIENIAKTIVEYAKLKREIAKELELVEADDEILIFGVDKGRYLDLIRNQKRPFEYELDLWESLLPKKQREMTQRELKKEARASVFMLVLTFFVFPVMIIMVSTLNLLVPMLQMLSFPKTLVSPVCILAAIAILALYGRFTARDLVNDWKSYFSLSKIPKNHVLYTLTDLEASALQILRNGLKGLSSDIVDFRGNAITLSDFVYRCACASTTRQKPSGRIRPVLFFASPHILEVNLREFFHAMTDVQAPLLPEELVSQHEITPEELTELSSEVVRLFETGSDKRVACGDTEHTLAWLYSNALRVGEFKRIEVVGVGKLPSYHSSEDVDFSIISKISSWL